MYINQIHQLYSKPKGDLLDQPESAYRSGQEGISEEGWGKKLLDLQDKDGKWGQGLYALKFISTHYTLLLLRRLEMPPNDQTKNSASS